MMSHRFWFVALAGTGVLVAAACAGAPRTSATVGTAGGTNGLLPAAYHATKYELDVFMQTKSSTDTDIQKQQYDHIRDQAHAAGVDAGIASDQGTTLWTEVVGCALRKGEKLGVNRSLSSEGLMTPDADAGAPWQPVPTPWPGDITATDARASTGRMEDIQTCLMAHLNAYGIKVKIFLSGPHVAPEGDPETLGFRHEEAVWLATIGAPGAGVPSLHLDVWPLPGLLTRCTGGAEGADEAAKAALHKRICGTAKGAKECGITPHSHRELEKDCKKKSASDGGIWWCRDLSVDCERTSCTYDRPAIATHLGRCAWWKLYGDQCSLAETMDTSMCSDDSIP